MHPLWFAIKSKSLSYNNPRENSWTSVLSFQLEDLHMVNVLGKEVHWVKCLWYNTRLEYLWCSHQNTCIDWFFIVTLTSCQAPYSCTLTTPVVSGEMKLPQKIFLGMWVMFISTKTTARQALGFHSNDRFQYMFLLWFRNKGIEKPFATDIFSLADQNLFDKSFFFFLF